MCICCASCDELPPHLEMYDGGLQAGEGGNGSCMGDSLQVVCLRWQSLVLGLFESEPRVILAVEQTFVVLTRLRFMSAVPLVPASHGN